MDLSVAICTWNRCDLLRQTLEGLTRVAVDGFTWEIVVVNNACTDDTDAVIAAFADRLPLRRIFESTPGLSPARNRAIQEARGKWIVFTDDDVLVDEHWLTSFMGTTRRFPRAAVIGGPIAPWFPVPPDELLVRVFPTLGTGFCGLDYGPVEQILAEQDVYGANMAFRLEGIGDQRFLEALGHKGNSQKAGDDIEFVRRIRSRGGDVVWSPDMKVRHYVLPKRMTVNYQAQWLTDWARSELRRTGGSSIPAGPLVAGAPRWLWRSVAVSYARWQLARLVGSREPALVRLKEHSILKGWLLESRAMAREGSA